MKLFRKHDGFNLIEIVVTTGLITVVFLGFSQVLTAYVSNQNNLAYADRKQDILITAVNLINNNNSWQKTIDSLSNTSLDCLKDPGKFPLNPKAGNCTMTDGGKIILLTGTGDVYIDSLSATSGFTLSRGPCSTYTTSGNDACPLRAELSWRPLCAGCPNPKVEITIQLTDSPLLRKTVQSKIIMRKLVRYAQKYDSDLVLYLKLDGAIGTTAAVGSTITDYIYLW